jgi:hypothetical protein
MTRTNLALLGRAAVHLRPRAGGPVRLRSRQACLRRSPKLDTGFFLDHTRQLPSGRPDAFRPLDARTPDPWLELPELRAGKIRQRRRTLRCRRRHEAQSGSRQGHHWDLTGDFRASLGDHLPENINQATVR